MLIKQKLMYQCYVKNVRYDRDMLLRNWSSIESFLKGDIFIEDAVFFNLEIKEDGNRGFVIRAADKRLIKEFLEKLQDIVQLKFLLDDKFNLLYVVDCVKFYTILKTDGEEIPDFKKIWSITNRCPVIFHKFVHNGKEVYVASFGQEKRLKRNFGGSDPKHMEKLEKDRRKTAEAIAARVSAYPLQEYLLEDGVF